MKPRFEMPDNLYFGGGGDTAVTPLALAILICGVLLILFLPRRYVIVPLLVAGLWLPVSVNILVAGFHFYALRVLLSAGCARVLIRGEVRRLYMNTFDKVFLSWTLCSASMYCFLWGWAAVSNRLGFLYTTLGSYFLMRVLIRDKVDIRRVLATLAIALALLAPFLLQEHLTGYNSLSILGANAVSVPRNGGIRAQGPFLHPVICGTLGAMLLPAFMALWWQGKWNRLAAVVGVFASFTMMIFSSSSTPLMTFAAGLAGFLLWPARHSLRWLRWGLVAALITIQLLMKAPVWYLLAHIGAATGGSGYHRATLIDTFVRHFSQWWLFGTQNNADWGYYMWDVDNAFVASGLQGGVLTFALFIAVFVFGFKMIGTARKRTETSTKDARLIWGIGCSLFANTVAFFGIFYFDQSILAWYGLLAMISAAGATIGVRSQKEISVVPISSASRVLRPLESKIPTGALFLR
jgi:hypothetical protein